MLVREKLTFERKQQGFSLDSLASRVGVDKGTLSRYETGRVKKIPKEALIRIAEILRLDFNEFVADDPQYCIYTNQSNDPSILSAEDKQLITWFHTLPTDVKEVFKQFWSIQIKS